MKSNIQAVIVFFVVFVLLAIMPIIPIQTAPVIPNQVYHLAFVSLVLLIGQSVTPMLGVSYRWEWYTAVMISAIPIVSTLAAVIRSRATTSPGARHT